MEKLHNKGRSPHKRFSTLSTDGKSPKTTFRELDFLPDGSHISPQRIVFKKSDDRNAAIREAEYIGSFPVVGEDQNARAEHVRKKLVDFRDNVSKSKPVLLVISLSGIKVCSHTGESVYMAHALKRISYATCDPEFRQFSFLAREPKGHSSSQFCHAFITKTAEEAEELNTIVGNAFKMAYAIQWEQEQRYMNVEQQAQFSDTSLEEQSEPSGQASPSVLQAQEQPTFHELIEQQVLEQRVKNEEYQQQQKEILQQQLNRISTPNIEEQLKERRERRQKEKEDLDREMEAQRMEGKSRMTWAKHVAQKSKHKMPVIDNIDGANISRLNGSPNNDTNTATCSPRFHSINELREAMETGSLRTYGSPVMTLKETIDHHCDFSQDKKKGSEGLQGETQAEVYRGDCDIQASAYMIDRPLPETPSRSHPNRVSSGRVQKASPKMNQSRDSTHYKNSTRSRSHSGSRSAKNGHQDSTSKRFSGRYQNDSPVHSRSNSSGSEIPEEGDVYQGPSSTLRCKYSGTTIENEYTMPRYDSIRRLDPKDLPVEEELKNASWYQHGIPREIALEILNQQEIGSFIVRDSTTHPGCYALSVKVPKFDNPVGISHYLIVRDPKRGVRLKGLDKVWPNLTALVTHHTVMPEMLPCTLRLPRNSSNPLFRDRDDEREENYQKITDFSGMVQEMKI